ncbi:hypothetical protein FRC04_005829 [Tulasnella sp. 424]|nr:hypothetical protein FRC04_005829 [Tulasnella sp. 424]KAG8961584.1 hypothetical protein FRC05_005916 [Tulasnella sp. 425]
MHPSASTGSFDRRPLESATYSQGRRAIVKETIKSLLSRNPDIAELSLGGTFLLAALETGDPEALEEALQFLEDFRDHCLEQSSGPQDRQPVPLTSGTQDRQLVPLTLEKPLEGGVIESVGSRDLLQIGRDVILALQSMYEEGHGVLHMHLTPQAAVWRRKDDNDLDVFLIDHDYEMYRKRKPDDTENQQ